MRRLNKARNIIKDDAHPGRELFACLPSERRCRSLKSKTNTFKNSSLPWAIRTVNSFTYSIASVCAVCFSYCLCLTVCVLSICNVPSVAVLILLQSLHNNKDVLFYSALFLFLFLGLIYLPLWSRKSGSSKFKMNNIQGCSVGRERAMSVEFAAADF